MLEDQFQTTIRRVEELWEHLLNKLCQQDIQIQEKDKLIKELKSIIYQTDYVSSDNSDDAEIYLRSSDDESTSSSLSE